MDAVDTKNASLLFSNVRRPRGHEKVILALFVAATLGISAVTINTYQNPVVDEVASRV
ncbi:MAG TPA: hypothetical protein VEJ89_16920 [Myxococcaceae bacterium]|jgi:hypothetical protein|nr:hypothetical protein [Myxococcaceae bacterium]